MANCAGELHVSCDILVLSLVYHVPLYNILAWKTCLWWLVIFSDLHRDVFFFFFFLSNFDDFTFSVSSLAMQLGRVYLNRGAVVKSRILHSFEVVVEFTGWVDARVVGS